MVKVCSRYSIPVFNAAERSGIYVWDAQFRKLFFQGANDTAHLNAKGHRLFMRKGESLPTRSVNGRETAPTSLPCIVLWGRAIYPVYVPGALLYFP